MKLLVENRFALLGLVAIALAALFGVAFVTRPEPGGATGGGSAETMRVESALRVCPPAQDDDLLTEAAAFTPYRGEEDGELLLTANRANARRLAEGELPGQLLTADVSEADEGRHTVLRAEGAFAGGLEAAQTAVAEDDDASASVVRCTEPGWSTWFTAPSGEDLKKLTVHLANVDSGTAVANVDVYAADGPIAEEETRGVEVPSEGEATVELGELTELGSSGRAVAVHVRTASGRVAASLFAERSKGGSEWAPATERPATRQVVAGVPAGGGSRTLVVAAPGDEPASVDVRLFGPDGEIEHEALDDLDVPPAASAALSLEGPLEKQAATVLVESDRPVVAGVLAEREGGDDSAYTAAAPALEEGPGGTAAVPADPDDTSTELLVGAVEQDASLIVTPVAEDGTTADPMKVEVAAGSTAEVEVESPKGAHALLLELSDGSGPVHAAAVLTQGKGEKRSTAVLPVPPAPAEVRLPPVVDSLTALP
ncbi:hypothetical protein J0910_27045 [Nocardiopsis sp. CNT-189]|uniref:DUF5719 family protein n=1 Tax=Nocardiopsis oceanisediminis TaxID=2816862 RepID=UPI003B2AA1D3